MCSKSRKLVKGSFLGMMSFFLRIAISLYMTPFVISSLGSKMYGLWMLSAAFFGFYGIFDFGLAKAVQRFMSRSLGLKDYKDANDVFCTSLIVFSVIGFVVFCLSIMISFFAHWFIQGQAEIVLFQKIVILLGAGLAIGFPMRSFWAIFSSHLRWDISIYIDLVNVLIKTFLFIVFLKNGYGVWALAVISFSTDLFWYSMNIVFSLKVAPYIRFSLKHFHASKIKEFFHYSIFSFISQLSEQIKFNIDNFIIASFLGLSFVTVYSIASRLIGYFIQLIYKSTDLLLPIFSQVEASGDQDQLKGNFLFVTKVNVYITSMIAFMMFLFGRSFIVCWVGKEFVDAYALLLLFLVPFALQLMFHPSEQLLYGIFKHKILAYINFGESIANLVLSLIFVRYWGLKGVALGTIVPILFVKLIVLPIYVMRVLELSFREYIFKSLVIPIVKLSLTFIPIKIFLEDMIRPNYLSLSLFSFCIGGFLVLYAFYFGVDKNEKYRLLHAIRLRKGNEG